MVMKKVHNKKEEQIIKENKRRLKLIYIGSSLFFIFILVIIISFNTSNSNFYKAYLSTRGDCFNLTQKDGFIVAGTVTTTNITSNYDNESSNITEIYNVKIKINIDNIKVIRHELCHLNQILEDRSHSCNNLLGVYKDELECYNKESDEPLTTKEQQLLALYS